MKTKIKTFLGSEKGMGLVNTLFILGLLMRGSGFTIAACVIWLFFLAYAKKNTSSKAMKVIYGIFIAIAALLLVINVYFMINFFVLNHAAG